MIRRQNRGNMSQCKNCGEHVSERFRRVFGDEHGEVYACPNCSANAGIGDTSRQRATDD
jgi:predicted SprT family Zn-dependent metalloprotease